MNTLIALPTAAPGGLEARIEPHFGHCAVFTLINLVDGQVAQVGVAPAPPHEQGGCMAPVRQLAQLGVKAMVAGGMGMRPLMGFHQAGIEVFHHGGHERVDQAVMALAQGRLVPFGQDRTCGGGGHGCGH